MTRPHSRKGEQGSALIYILIAIALLALLTVTFMQPSSQQTGSSNTFKLVSDLQSQVEFIRSSVQECVALYYKGNMTTDTTAGAMDEGADHRYPLRPDSDRFATATIPPTAGRLVKDIRCPGNPGADPVNDTVADPHGAENHTPIFSGSSGKFLPPPPDLFQDWQWYNGVDGVFYWISTDKTDSFIQSALEKLLEKFADCEADIVTGGTDLDAAGDVECAAGNTCFRLWMIRRTACP